MRAVYCYCKNTYSIKGCNNKKKCKDREHWKHGIGKIRKISI